MEKKRNIEKGDLVERLQGKKVIDLGVVAEVYESRHKVNNRYSTYWQGWYSVYWQGLKRYQDVHELHLRIAEKKK